MAWSGEISEPCTGIFLLKAPAQIRMGKAHTDQAGGGRRAAARTITKTRDIVANPCLAAIIIRSQKTALRGSMDATQSHGAAARDTRRAEQQRATKGPQHAVITR